MILFILCECIGESTLDTYHYVPPPSYKRIYGYVVPEQVIETMDMDVNDVFYGSPVSSSSTAADLQYGIKLFDVWD